MVESYLLYPFQNMATRGWIFLGLWIIGSTLICRKRYISKKKNLLLILLAVYVGVLLCMTVVGRAQIDEVSYELIPFWSWKRAIMDIVQRKDYLMLYQIIINILMFIPIGAMVYILSNKKFRIAVWGIVSFSLIVEIMQLLFSVGVFEWDDTIHNMIGSLLGVWLVQMLNKRAFNMRI